MGFTGVKFHPTYRSYYYFHKKKRVILGPTMQSTSTAGACSPSSPSWTMPPSALIGRDVVDLVLRGPVEQVAPPRGIHWYIYLHLAKTLRSPAQSTFSTQDRPKWPKHSTMISFARVACFLTHIPHTFNILSHRRQKKANTFAPGYQVIECL